MYGAPAIGRNARAGRSAPQSVQVRSGSSMEASRPGEPVSMLGATSSASASRRTVANLAPRCWFSILIGVAAASIVNEGGQAASAEPNSRLRAPSLSKIVVK
jgi:hypothetical protein